MSADCVGVHWGHTADCSVPVILTRSCPSQRERSRERHTHTHTHTHTQTHRQTDIFMAIDCCVVQISVSNPYATDEEEVANGSVGPAALSVACSRLVHALTGTAMERERECVCVCVCASVCVCV